MAVGCGFVQSEVVLYLLALAEAAFSYQRGYHGEVLYLSYDFRSVSSPDASLDRKRAVEGE